jgi:Fructose-2,6-bisphosphatase
MRLYVVRHGQSESNMQGKWGGHYNTPLTSKGLEQAKQLSDKLTDTNFEIIISSSLIRARQTAEIIQERVNVPLISSDVFMERNMGVYEGLTQEEIMGKYPDLWNRHCTRSLDDAPTNGETYRKFHTRINKALIKLKEDYSDKNVLLVTHGFVARVINWCCSDISFDEMHGYNLENCEIAKFTI